MSDDELLRWAVASVLAGDGRVVDHHLYHDDRHGLDVREFRGCESGIKLTVRVNTRLACDWMQIAVLAARRATAEEVPGIPEEELKERALLRFSNLMGIK